MVTLAKKSAHDIKGYEFDWLASDANGHVAFFSTAGGGYVPAEFLQDTDAHDAAIDAILSLNASTRTQFAADLPSDLKKPVLPSGLRNTWGIMAERGLFAFDSDPNGGPYRLVAAPEIPTSINELPSQAVKILSELKLNHIKFALVSIISKDQF